MRQAVSVKRVSVVGNAGVGKTRLARRLAENLGVPHIELDAIHHLPGWEPMGPGAFLAEVETLTSAESSIQHRKYQQRLSSARNSPTYAHLHFVRLQSRTEIDHWLTNLDDEARRRPEAQR